MVFLVCKTRGRVTIRLVFKFFCFPVCGRTSGFRSIFRIRINYCHNPCYFRGFRQNTLNWKLLFFLGRRHYNWIRPKYGGESFSVLQLMTVFFSSFNVLFLLQLQKYVPKNILSKPTRTFGYSESSTHHSLTCLPQHWFLLHADEVALTVRSRGLRIMSSLALYLGQ